MLNFASFCPHPAVIIPEIGKSEAIHVEKTVLAMQTLGQKFAKQKPEKVLLISPHTLLLHNRIALSYAEELTGGMGGVHGPDIIQSFSGEKKLAEEIRIKTQQKFIATQLVCEENSSYPLSHGEMVPLYFLSKEHTDFDLLISGFSNYNLEKHFKYGKIIGNTIKQSPQKIAFIASGDLSHRLSTTSPGGFSTHAKKFDEKILKWIEKKEINKILDMDQHLIEEAGECGLRSLVVLLGVLSNFKYNIEILSYEAPFGVGYATINFEILN